MTTIEVYNPKPSPIIYGDGKTIGGLEWVTVEQEDVQGLIDANELIVNRPEIYVEESIPEPQEDLAPETETFDKSLADDTHIDETAVSSDEVIQNEVVEVIVEDALSDATETDEKSATIRKTRRSKTTATERE